MSEKIEVYDLEGNFLKLEDRNKFYKSIKREFNRKGKITRKVKRVLLLLLNSNGKIVLQKRNNTKNENAGLFDKTIGGHVEADDSYDLTLIKECSEELGFPVSILDISDFERGLRKTDLKIIGLFKELDYDSNFLSTRITQDGKKFIQPYMHKIYIGYYNGPIQFIDGESSGIQLFTLEELEQEIKQNPSKFTDDLKFMVKKYKTYLKPIN